MQTQSTCSFRSCFHFSSELIHDGLILDFWGWNIIVQVVVCCSVLVWRCGIGNYWIPRCPRKFHSHHNCTNRRPAFLFLDQLLTAVILVILHPIWPRAPWWCHQAWCQEVPRPPLLDHSWGHLPGPSGSFPTQSQEGRQWRLLCGCCRLTDNGVVAAAMSMVSTELTNNTGWCQLYITIRTWNDFYALLCEIICEFVICA